MVAPSSSNHLTSWNTIVSGNQTGKAPLKSDDPSIKSTIQILSKESANFW